MSNKLCISEIRCRYDSLTAAEKRIADQILNNPIEVAGLSAAALAKRACTASSAVIRFCRSLEFEGYSDFKMHLAVELAQSEPIGFMPGISANDSTSEIVEKVFAANIKSLKDTLKRMNYSVFESVINRMAESSCIYVYGLGTSASAAVDLQYRLMTLGYHAFAFSDAAQMAVSALNINETDVVIGITNSGRTKCILDTLSLARSRGATTVCITSHIGSPATRLCDYVLMGYSTETKYPIEAVSARTALASIIDALAAALSVRSQEPPESRAQAIHKVVNTLLRQGGK